MFLAVPRVMMVRSTLKLGIKWMKSEVTMRYWMYRDIVDRALIPDSMVIPSSSGSLQMVYHTPIDMPVGATTMMMTTKVVICLVRCSERSPTEERLSTKTQRRSQSRSRKMITMLHKMSESKKTPQKESVLLDQF